MYARYREFSRLDIDRAQVVFTLMACLLIECKNDRFFYDLMQALSFIILLETMRFIFIPYSADVSDLFANRDIFFAGNEICARLIIHHYSSLRVNWSSLSMDFRLEDESQGYYHPMTT